MPVQLKIYNDRGLSQANIKARVTNARDAKVYKTEVAEELSKSSDPTVKVME